MGFRVGLWGEAKGVQGRGTCVAVLFDEIVKSSFHFFLQRDNSGKVANESITDSLLGSGMSALVILSTNESTLWDRCRVEQFRKILLSGKGKINLDRRVVITFSIEVVRDVSGLGLVAAGSAAASGRFLGRRARIPFARRICVIGRTHNLLEPDNTCSRDFLNTSNRFVVGDNGGISDSKQ